ncbi:heme-binding protein [Nonomuraea sp. NBC_01738]|uniref:GlcG/HbpS family heme-binding protein n=1 Tax=Nonomuraea sp. NBC_01738 TaxID=2976003 RepID=UPI002E104B01|nr:heme-binding protein [Nonomuraea sp. NBC_01738]
MKLNTRLAAAALAALAVTGVGATSAMAATPVTKAANGKAVVQTSVLSADAAMKIADAASKEAVKRGQKVTIAIVDRSGVTRLVLKGDGSGPQTEESAKRKAFTAVSFGQATSKLASNQALAAIPGTLLLAGGVPVASGGAPIAGIGVGGAPSGDIDEAIAQAGLQAVQGQLG